MYPLIGVLGWSGEVENDRGVLLACAALWCEEPASAGDGQACVVLDQPAGDVAELMSGFHCVNDHGVCPWTVCFWLLFVFGKVLIFLCGGWCGDQGWWWGCDFALAFVIGGGVEACTYYR